MSNDVTHENDGIVVEENLALQVMLNLEDALHVPPIILIEESTGTDAESGDGEQAIATQPGDAPPVIKVERVLEAYQEDLDEAYQLLEIPGFYVFEPQAKTAINQRLNNPQRDPEIEEAFGDKSTAQKLLENHRPLPGFFPYQQTDKVHLRVAGDRVGEACDAMMPVIAKAAREHPDLLLEFKIVNEEKLRESQDDDSAERVLRQAQITFYAWQNVEDSTDDNSNAFCQIIAEITDRLRMMNIAASDHSAAESDLPVNEYFSFRQDRDDSSGEYVDPRSMDRRELAKFKAQMQDRPLFGRLVGGPRVKGKYAEDFDRRRGKITKELNRFPSFVDGARNLRDALAAADELAESGDFKAAYQSLENLHKRAKRLAKQYDPTQDLADFRQKVDEFVQSATHAANGMREFERWITDTAEQRRAALVVPDALDVIENSPNPDTAEFPDWQQWHIECEKRLTDTLTALIAGAKSFWRGVPSTNSVKRFITTANARIDSLIQESIELEKGCSQETQQQELINCWEDLRDGVIQNPQIDILRQTPDGFRSGEEIDRIKSELGQRLEETVAVSREQLHILYDRLRALLPEKYHQAIPATMSAAIPEALAEEFVNDWIFLSDTERESRDIHRFEAFDFADFANTTGGTLHDDFTSDDVLQFETVGRNMLAQYLEDRNLAADSDAVFDLSLKTSEQIANEYAIARGWNPTQLSHGQQATAKAIATGMETAISQIASTNITPDGSVLNWGGRQFVNPVPIGTGGFGTIVRYEDPTTGERIAVKSMKSRSVCRDEIVNELMCHRHLMKGDPNSVGRQNIVALKDVAKSPDGTLHIVMEFVDGGDLEENRFGMIVASELGAIPEPARALLNQYQMKQALEGMIYMRDQNMIHFDLKGENIFVDSNGTVKIADFGSARIGENQDGTVDNQGAGTRGYSAPEKGVYDDRFDAYSAGRVIATMQAKTSEALHLQTGFTGALQRMLEPLTSKEKNERPTLEAILASSYFNGLDDVAEEDIRELGELAIEYGKAAKNQRARIVERYRMFFPGDVERYERGGGEMSYKDLMACIQYEIVKAHREIAEATAELKVPDLDDSERNDLSEKIKAAQQMLSDMNGVLAAFNDSPELKTIGERLREVSARLTGPASDTDDRDQLLLQLESTLDEPAQFFNYVSLSAMRGLLEDAGISQSELVAAASTFQLNVSESNPNAARDLRRADARIREFVASIQDEHWRTTLHLGLKGIFNELRRQFEATHPGENWRGQRREGIGIGQQRE